MPHADRLTDKQDTEHVEPIGEPGSSVPIDPNPGTPPQLTLLADMHRLDRRTEPFPPTRLDLDERHEVLAPNDQIDIAAPAPEAMRHDPPAVPAQPTRGDPLTPQAEILSRFRHGASLSPPSDKSRTIFHRLGSFERRSGPDGPTGGRR